MPHIALARPEDVDYAIRQDFGRADLTEGMIALDLPQHSDAGMSVPLTVTADSPMTAADHPEELRLYGTGNPRPRIATLRFTPLSGQASFSTRVRLAGAQDVVAVMRTTTGAHWRTDRRVSVAFGACANAGNSDDLPADWVPTMRVSVPPVVERGTQIELRTIITHPMETGLRLNAFTQYVPRRIIETFVCRLDDETVFSARLEPAIATNPYLAFGLRADRGGTLVFEWEETGGAIWRETATLTVG